MESTGISLLFIFISIVSVSANDPITSKSVGDDKDISMNTETRFVKDGSKLEVECKMKFVDGKPAKLKFMNDTDATELKSTDRLKININDKYQGEKGSYTIGKIVWDPIYVADNAVKIIRCRNDDTSKSKQFRLVVIPTSRIPTIKIQQGSSVELERNVNQHKLVCFVTCETCKAGEDFKAQWRLFIDIKKLPETMSQDFVKLNATTGMSTLTINDTSLVDKKKLLCVAELKFKDFEAVKDVKQEINVTVTGEPVIKKFAKEFIVRADDDVKLDCFNAVDKVSSKVTWYKQDEYQGDSSSVVLSGTDLKDFGARYSYEKSVQDPSTSADNSVISIVDVLYEDRSQFVCKAEYFDMIVNTTITLRVRDPLGAVWPVIGILVEALIMVIVIWYSEFLRGKEEKKKNAGTSFAMDEKAPNDTTDNAPLMKSNADGSTTA